MSSDQAAQAVTFSELVTSRETHGLSHDMHGLMTHVRVCQQLLA